MFNKKIPLQAIQALKVVEELLGNSIIGVYLFGSAVTGGLRINSDVDVLVIVNNRLDEVTRAKLIKRLMPISGKVGNTSYLRPIELTVINHRDVMPWQYPPKKEFVYGEWLREEFEKGHIHVPNYDPDLAIVLAQARINSFSLFGPDASNILPPVPLTDIRRAIRDSLPELIEGIKGDERNVILTLARMWKTVCTGEINPKDVAAEWAIPLLPKEHATLLDIARIAYRGECIDDWEGQDHEVMALINFIIKAVESNLNNRE